MFVYTLMCVGERSYQNILSPRRSSGAGSDILNKRLIKQLFPDFRRRRPSFEFPGSTRAGPWHKRVGTMSFCSSPHPWGLAEYLEHAKYCYFSFGDLLKMTYAKMLCLPGLVQSVSLTPQQATVDPRLCWRTLNIHRRMSAHPSTSPS